MTRTKDLLALYLDGLEIVVSGGPVCPFTQGNPTLKGAWPVLYSPRNPSDPSPWVTLGDRGNVKMRYASGEVHCPDVGGGPVTLAHRKVAADVARLRSYGWMVEVRTDRYSSIMSNYVYVQVSATRLWFEEHILWSFTTSTNNKTGAKGTKFGGGRVYGRSGSGNSNHYPKNSDFRFQVMDEYGMARRYCGDFTTAGQHHRHNAEQGRTRPSEPWLTEQETSDV
jgi:hypothetical protein